MATPGKIPYFTPTRKILPTPMAVLDYADFRNHWRVNAIRFSGGQT